MKILIKNLKNLHIAWQQVEEIKATINNKLSEYETELALDCSDCESSCSFMPSDENTVKNLNNKNLMNMLNLDDLNKLDSSLTVLETHLKSFGRELTNLCKFSPDDITEADLESVYSKYSLALAKFKNETKYLRELLKQKERNESYSNKKSHLFNSLSQKIDLDSNKIRTNTSFNYEHGEFFAKLHLDLNSAESIHYDELKTSTPRYKHIEIENTISPFQGAKIKRKLDITNLENKSIQTDKVNKNDEHKSVDSGIITSMDSTDVGSFSASTPAYLTKMESSTENVSSQKLELLKEPEKINFFKKDLEEQSDDGLRRRNVQVIEKINEVEFGEIETESQLAETNGKHIAGAKFSFNKILLYGFFFAFVFVFFVYSVMPKIMPSCCDFNRDYLFFNVRTLFGDDEDRLVAF